MEAPRRLHPLDREVRKDEVRICSSDDVYAEQAEATAAALKAAGAKRVYLAGKGDYPSVDEYVHLGVDALDVLTRAEALR